MLNSVESNGENISILNELKFEDQYVLHNLFKKIFNTSSSGSFNETSFNKNQNEIDLKNLNSLICYHKILLKINKINLPNNINHNTNINNNTNNNENSVNSVLVVKILTLIEIFKLNFLSFNTTKNSNSLNTVTGNFFNKINTTDCNEIIYQIYSLILDETSNEVNIKILDNLIHFILNEHLVTNINTFYNLINLLENNITSNEANGNSTGNSNLKITPKAKNNSAIGTIYSKITFENFQKYFKTCLYFYIYCDKYKNIFEILDFENKSKILTAELIVCFNKLLRNLEDDNIFSIFIKKYLQLIDTNQIFFSKYEYYFHLLKSFSL